MESKEELKGEIASSRGRVELVATQPERSTSAAMEEAETTYFEYCNDDFTLVPSSTQVGTIPLIVDNILRFCDTDTIQACTRVNHLWRNLAIPSASLRIRDFNNDGSKELLQKVGNLRPFIHLELYGVNLHHYWINYSPNLVTLQLHRIDFERSSDIYEILFASFPCLKTLDLDTLTVRYQSPLPDVQIVTPKLEKLRICFANRWNRTENENFMNSDFCSNVFSKLRNLQELRLQNVHSHECIPIFEALTRGNISLQILEYDEKMAPVDISTVFNHYLRIFGDSLRKLYIRTYISIRNSEVLRGYAGRNLQQLILKDDDYHLELDKQTDWKFKMSDADCEDDLPGITGVTVTGTCTDFSKPFPSLANRCLTVECVTLLLGSYDFQDEIAHPDNREARHVLFEHFPNVLHLRIEADCRSSSGVIDIVQEAGRNWPHLRSLSVKDMYNTGWNCYTWSKVIENVALHLTDLEDVSFLDEQTIFDSMTTLQVLLLPHLKRLHVRKLKISSRLLKLLTNHVDEFESTLLILQD